MAQQIPGFKTTQLSTLDPMQKQLYGNLHQQLGPGLSSGVNYLGNLASGNPDAYAQMEAPAFENYNKMLGQLGSRFSQVGARDSSAFDNLASQGASDLSQNLASNRNSIQQDAIRQLLGLSQNLMGQQTFQNFHSPKPNWQSILGGLASEFAGGLGSGISSGGSGIMSLLSKLLGG